MKAEMMNAAHRLAKASKQKVSYRAKLSAALRRLWNSVKTMDNQIRMLSQRNHFTKSDRRLSKAEKLKYCKIWIEDFNELHSVAPKNYSNKLLAVLNEYNSFYSNLI